MDPWDAVYTWMEWRGLSEQRFSESDLARELERRHCHAYYNIMDPDDQYLVDALLADWLEP